MRILFISANPSSTDKKLDLGDELRRFQHGLQGHDVKVMLLPAAQPDDLKMAIKTGKFDIVHFSGHARDDGILMRNAAGIEELFDKDDLADLFAKEKERSGRKIPLAFLNACETKKTAEAIDKTKSIGMIIGTNAKLDDAAAKVMTQVFYKSIGNKCNLADAFNEATGILDKHFPGTNVYEPFGSEEEQGENLLTDDRSDDHGVEVNGLPAWDKHFHVTHLEKQIHALEDQVNSNLNNLTLFGSAGIVALVLLLMVAHPFDHKALFPFLLDNRESLVGKKPLLEWLGTIGAAIPLMIASFKNRFLINSNEELRLLRQLMDLVKSSDKMSDELKNKLRAIMEQSVRGAKPE